MSDESTTNGDAGTARPRPRTATKAAKPASADETTVKAGTSAAKARSTSAVPAIDEDGASISAESVALRLSAVGRVDSGQLEVQQGAVGAVRADRVAVDQGAIGAAMANHVEVSRGYARSILSRQAQLDRSAARIVIAADVRADRSAVMFLVARKVEGNVRVLFDWRGALAFGAVAGVIFAVLSRARRKG